MTKVPRLINSFTPSHYALFIDLSKAKDRVFTGSVDITGVVPAGASKISLHSKDLTITSASINGSPVELTYNELDELSLGGETISPGEHTVSLKFSGKITDAMHGLYPCYFEHDGIKKELFATQFESHHAREVFPCVDEPEAKATYDISLTTQPGVTVLSNQPIKQQQEEGGLVVSEFETTPRMSSYLVAWVVGELHKKSANTKDGVEVSVWATPAQRPEALDFALEHAVKTIEFFDEYFGVAYPLQKCDQVALPDFSSGAMENWGLVTYRETALLADPRTTTVESKRYIATVISHELSHQWFGNLVTMKWWNNLWLNESFATLMEYVAVDAIHPEWNAWLDFASSETIAALRRDAIDGVQSVQVEVNHPDEISSLFDGAIVYAKGARLMKMCRQFIGDDAFRRGLKSYFTEFAHQNTEADDLWRHLSAASGQDVGALMNAWISQSGYPVVHVTDDGLSQEQFFIGAHEPSIQLWPIPLDATAPRDDLRLLATKTSSVAIANGERLNRTDSSHFITHYSRNHLAQILSGLSELDEIGRLQILHEQTLLARGGIIPSANLVNLLDAYKAETAESVWSIMSLTVGELKKFVETNQTAEDNLKLLTRSLASNQYRRLGWQTLPNEAEDDTRLRSLIIGLMIYGEDDSAINQAKTLYSGGLDLIDPELRALVLASVVKHTTNDEVVFDLLDAYRTTMSADIRDDICSGLTNARSRKYVGILLEQLTDKNTVRKQDVFRWFAYLMRNQFAKESTWQWMVDEWNWITDAFGGDKSYDSFVRYSASGLTTQAQLDNFMNFFLPKRDVLALTRVIDLGIIEIKSRVELIKSDGPAVIEELNSWSQHLREP